MLMMHIMFGLAQPKMILNIVHVMFHSDKLGVKRTAKQILIMIGMVLVLNDLIQKQETQKTMN